MTDSQRSVAKSSALSLQHVTVQNVEEMLKSIVDMGSTNVKMLDAELKSAESARKNAMEEFKVCL